jgi:hypothetical protein
MSSNIRAAFDRAYNGQRNFMTPQVVCYGKRGRLLYELSKGPAMAAGSSMWGVTVIEVDGAKRSDLSRCFHDYDEANAYIRNGLAA